LRKWLFTKEEDCVISEYQGSYDAAIYWAMPYRHKGEIQRRIRELFPASSVDVCDVEHDEEHISALRGDITNMKQLLERLTHTTARGIGPLSDTML
jgi:hypothetical protein